MPLSPEQIAGCWRQEYEKAPATLARMSEINTLAAAFNANVDSVVKISGAELQRRIRQTGMTLAELKNDADRSIRRPEDVLRGIFRCFTLGIAEEWIAQDKEIYRWMKKETRHRKLANGRPGRHHCQHHVADRHRQGRHPCGCSARTSGTAVFQTRQPAFLRPERHAQNRLTPSTGRTRKASIHWIIEFDKRRPPGKRKGKTFVCPKSNRFIATYDPGAV